MHLKEKFRLKGLEVKDDSVITGEVYRWYGIANEETMVQVSLELDGERIFYLEKMYYRRLSAEKAANRLVEDAKKLAALGVNVNGKILKLKQFTNRILNSVEEVIEEDESFGLIDAKFLAEEDIDANETLDEIFVPKGSICGVEYREYRKMIGSGLMIVHNGKDIAFVGSHICDKYFSKLKE